MASTQLMKTALVVTMTQMTEIQQRSALAEETNGMEMPNLMCCAVLIGTMASLA
jgi:hypothetical protein